MSRIVIIGSYIALAVATALIVLPTLAFVGYPAPLDHVLRLLPTFQPDALTTLTLTGLMTGLMLVLSFDIGSARSFWRRLAARTAEPVPNSI